MIVARPPLAVEVILMVVFLICSFADVGDIPLSIDVFYQCQPRFSRGRSIRFGIKPTIFDARNHRKRKHACRRRFRPRRWVVNQLPPHTVGGLIFEERCHHFAVAVPDFIVIRIGFRQNAEQFGHAHRHPTVAASPKKRHVGRVIKQAVGSLNFF